MAVTTQVVRPSRRGTLQARAPHGLQPVRDDPNLVPARGLAVLHLADSAGLAGMLDECQSAPAPRATIKTRTLLAGIPAGADDSNGMDVLRAGSNAAVMGEARAQSRGHRPERHEASTPTPPNTIDGSGLRSPARAPPGHGERDSPTPCGAHGAEDHRRCKRTGGDPCVGMYGHRRTVHGRHPPHRRCETPSHPHPGRQVTD